MGVEKNISMDKFPKQHLPEETVMGGIGRIVNVCFNYDSAKRIRGVIIRDDKEYPGVTIIRLVDGRIVLSSECQYSTTDEVYETVTRSFIFKNR
ncbi:MULTISPECIES: hypothetical protein [Butyricimonas]|uniref:hypothetical protein n=1 Tax=Butyricimonas TaxID=574697 RepID=UPI0007FB2F9E|nr:MULTISPECIES: hypothetical protein [Butyricimonas]